MIALHDVDKYIPPVGSVKLGTDGLPDRVVANGFIVFIVGPSKEDNKMALN